MKKLFLILIVTAITSTAWSQSQLSTVRGKTKDGKTVKVEYYQGAVEDVIKSVKYQLVEIGKRLGNKYEIISGVNEGDKIVTEGQIRLKDGVTVQVKK